MDIQARNFPVVCPESQRRQRELSAALRSYAETQNITYVDTTPELQAAAQTQIIWHETHFNQVGYTLYSAALSQAIAPILTCDDP
jgi:lysophospholipase L1-like esterase